MVYSYMFPINEVRVHNAYMPSVRGTMNAVRFIMNDPRALIPHSGAASEVEPAIFSAPFLPNAEILSDAVAEELKAYFYRTMTFQFGTRRDLIDRCLYTPSFRYQLRKVSVTFRAALHYSGRYLEDVMQLHALEKLFELPLNVNIAVIIDPGVVRYNRFLGMVKVAFPILDALEDQGYALSLLLEPVWRFEGRRKWVRFKSARDYEDDGISIKNVIHSTSFPHPLFHVGVFVAYAIAQKGPYDQEEAVNALSALFCLKKGTKIRITMDRQWMMELSDVHEWEVESMFELMSPLLDRLKGAGYLVDLIFETDVPFVFNPTVTKLTVASLKKRAADVSTITNNTHLRARIKLLT
jgi:hypothetical protein